MRRIISMREFKFWFMGDYIIKRYNNDVTMDEVNKDFEDWVWKKLNATDTGIQEIKNQVD